MKNQAPRIDFLTRLAVLLTGLLCLATLFLSEMAIAAEGRSAPGASWSRFRGPDGAGVSEARGIPDELGPEENVLWMIDCGPGSSSPNIFDRRLFYTAFENDKRLLHCVDATTGKLMWTKSYVKLRDEVATPPSGPATPTPVADDAGVYVFFPDTGLIACSHSGEDRWRVDVGPFDSFHGVSASLVIVDEKLVLLVDQVQGSFMVAYDVRTGIESWKVSREDGALGGYSTPATRMSAAGRIELVVSGPVDAAGFDPVDGTRNWSVDGVTNSPVSVPLVSANRVFLCEPSFTENPFKMDVLLPFDKDKNGKVSLDELKSSIQLTRVARRVDERWGNGDGVVEAAELEMAFQGFVGGGGLVAIELDAAAGATKPRVLWSYRKQVPHIASLLLYNDILYFVNQGGILTSMDPASGEVLKRARVGHGSAYYASPVAADGKLYLIDAEGKLAVVSAEADWKVVATGDLGESCLATPAIVDGRIYVRTQRKLYCFGKAV